MGANGELAINLRLGWKGMMEAGHLIRSPNVFEFRGRDCERAIYVTTRPLQIQGPDGIVHPLQKGDVLTRAECEHAGSALRAMVLRGELVELDATRGLPRLWQLEREKAQRLERTLADVLAGDAA